jgi:hypothetical protein
MHRISLIPPTVVVLAAQASDRRSVVTGFVHLDDDASGVVEVRAEPLDASAVPVTLVMALFARDPALYPAWTQALSLSLAGVLPLVSLGTVPEPMPRPLRAVIEAAVPSPARIRRRADLCVHHRSSCFPVDSGPRSE